MNLREIDPRNSDLPLISPKTSIGQLEIWSKQGWKSDGKRSVASDMVNNCRELLAGRESVENVDAALGSIAYNSLGMGNPQKGWTALAQACGSVIGGLAVGGKWNMHSPEPVYLSAVCFTSKLDSSKWEDFKEELLEVAASYGKKTLPNPELYIKILDFLLESRNRDKNRRYLIVGMTSLLKDKGVQGAYDLMKSFNNSVGGRRRRVI